MFIWSRSNGAALWGQRIIGAGLVGALDHGAEPRHAEHPDQAIGSSQIAFGAIRTGASMGPKATEPVAGIVDRIESRPPAPVRGIRIMWFLA
ncbi:hypothetical protein [Arenibaculum pallidiluteum]|uniref:hypothetical protein n=1 Tax=Arenibaculum pallidiluteum TaxID=2812559 RepID=UPI001A958AC2|nr:hypothetical protein [Arenibaculum pallidiluteum]